MKIPRRPVERASAAIVQFYCPVGDRLAKAFRLRSGSRNQFARTRRGRRGCRRSMSVKHDVMRVARNEVEVIRVSHHLPAEHEILHVTPVTG